MMDIRANCPARQIKRICPGLSTLDRGVPGSQGRNLETMAEGKNGTVHGDVPEYALFAQSIQDIMRYGKPKNSGEVTIRSNGQVVAQVVPYDWKEQWALPGIHAEVWMDPSVSLQNGGIPQASFFHSQDRKGRFAQF